MCSLCDTHTDTHTTKRTCNEPHHHHHKRQHVDRKLSTQRWFACVPRRLGHLLQYRIYYFKTRFGKGCRYGHRTKPLKPLKKQTHFDEANNNRFEMGFRWEDYCALWWWVPQTMSARQIPLITRSTQQFYPHFVGVAFRTKPQLISIFRWHIPSSKQHLAHIPVCWSGVSLFGLSSSNIIYELAKLGSHRNYFNNFINPNQMKGKNK